MDDYLYQSIIEHASDAIVVTDAGTDYSSIIFVNEAYCNMTGYSKDEVIGKTPKILQGPETDRNELDKLKHALETSQPGHAELINYKKNGEKFWTSISIFPIKDESNNLKYWVGIKRDVTDKRNAFDELNATLQELHHRVKNNLAITSALLQLKALNADNESFSSAIMECTSRIKTIANIHELLYKSETFSHIDIGKGLETVVRNIVETVQLETGIKLQFNINQIGTFNINQAVPFSLIVNEVILNTIRHAFPDKKNGRIHVKLSQDNKNRIKLEITDNGKGLPPDFNHKEISTSGMQIINTLAKQINADYNYSNRKKGTSFTLNFVKEDVYGAHYGKYVEK